MPRSSSSRGDAGSASSRGPDPAARERFVAFVRTHRATLLAIAAAVTGSRAEAEDLVQSALASAFPRWHRIDDDRALAYVRRSILNANSSHWRHVMTGQRTSTLTDIGPVAAANAMTTVDDRLSLLPLMRALPARQRSVLVLRYLCDLPDQEIATTLGIAPGTVRSQAARGLDTLRARAGQLRDEPPWPEDRMPLMATVPDAGPDRPETHES